ncbi:dephospho-CoA kinase [Salpingoeca rosetta]|uniref:Dephospho-CoA kinase n=1 Tax=Salpingoeca rosetta (strain ATCC 50818 / BSB-021) TaxID=946362 RepID=F2U131_SALR5|nr:dephospho-CoA kinase [Salpingoeca rosetta]EGD80605.1 dephospho-CoA kinase [Salpingoeca rosetta]|eukprot:XP_004997166.1 dephospho-CoA kinase [Salpingoeca rosetta]
MVLMVVARLAAGLISASAGLLLDRVRYGTLLAGTCCFALDLGVFGLAHWPSLLAATSLAIFFSRFRVIGLTGGVGCGKSTVCKMLTEKGAVVIDADAISHNVLLRGRWGYRRFVAAFAKEIAERPELLDTESGQVNRSVLRQIAFEDRSVSRKLNKALHLPIGFELLQQLLSARFLHWRPFVVLDAPLLLETGLNHICKWVITVSCTEEQQVQRVMGRDLTTAEDARRIIATQMPLEKKVKLSDHIIANDGTLAQLRQRVDACVRAAPTF